MKMKEITLTIGGGNPPYTITAAERQIGTQFENYCTELIFEMPAAESCKIAVLTVKSIRNKFVDRIKIINGRVALSSNVTQNGAIRASVCFIDDDGGQTNTSDIALYFIAASKPDGFVAEIPELAEAVAAQGKKSDTNAADITDIRAKMVTGLTLNGQSAEAENNIITIKIKQIDGGKINE
jgi:hypothetical protein